MVSNIRQHIKQAALVDAYDESHGVFGELIEAGVVLKALNFEDNVGKLDDPDAAQAITALHSLSCQEQSSIVVEFDNISNYPVVLRWMDEHGQNPSSHHWTIDPCSTFVQYSRPGHLFIASVVLSGEERLLGAYRTLKPLPSGSPHCVLIEQQSEQEPGQQSEPESGQQSQQGDGANPWSSESQVAFFFESMLTDTSKIDALTVAAAGLDGGGKHPKTLTTLARIVNNVVQHPEEKKFQRLRMSNPVVQHHIVACKGAIQMLHLLDFRETTDGDEECLLLASEPNMELFQRAAHLLNLLQERSKPDFVAELAASVPWQPPVLTSQHATHWNFSGTHFISPEERWARTERWAALRSSRGGHRPPLRGEAPSSRGLWGR